MHIFGYFFQKRVLLRINGHIDKNFWREGADDPDDPDDNSDDNLDDNSDLLETQKLSIRC